MCEGQFRSSIGRPQIDLDRLLALPDASRQRPLAAVKAFADVLAGTGKPLVATSGVLGLAMFGLSGRPGTEDDTVPGGPRVDNENLAISLADQGVRSSVVRLAPMVR